MPLVLGIWMQFYLEILRAGQIRTWIWNNVSGSRSEFLYLIGIFFAVSIHKKLYKSKKNYFMHYTLPSNDNVILCLASGS